MRDPKLLSDDIEIPVAEVLVEQRLRKVSEAAVDSLVASITELGVLADAIHVRKVKHRDGKLYLVDGAHRLEAAQRLGWEKIPAKVWDCTDDWARLMEIDGNQAGAELSPLDTSLFLAERKKLWDKLHPEAVQGKAGASARWDATDIVSLASATAEKFGVSERQIYRMVAAGERLGPSEANELRKAPKPVTLKDLAEIGKISEPSERYFVCTQLAEGKAKNAVAARSSYAVKKGSKPAPEDPVDTDFKGLLTAWRRASKSARRRFVEEENVALFNLLKDFDGGLAE